MKFVASTVRRLGLAVLTIVLVATSFAFFTPPQQQQSTKSNWGSDKGMLAFEPAKLTIHPR
jgi:plastocyanin